MAESDRPVIEARAVSVAYQSGRLTRHRTLALHDISLQLEKSATLGVIGPSGAGKSTLALSCAGLLRPIRGCILHLGRDPYGHSVRRTRQGPSPVQMVFQNPFAALNPRRTVRNWLDLVLRRTPTAPEDDTKSAADYLDSVGLSAHHLEMLPGDLSGGECQRVCIAAGLAANAKALILDEPVSMLDSIARKEVVSCLTALQERHSLAYLVVAHDLAFVSEMCARVMVIEAGRMVEEGPTHKVFQNPQEAVTRALVMAASTASCKRR